MSSPAECMKKNPNVQTDAELIAEAQGKTSSEAASIGMFCPVKFDFIKFFLDKNDSYPKPDSFNKEMFDLLFFDFLTYIKAKQWIYASSKTEKYRSKNVLDADSRKQLVVNCFDLSKAFLDLLLDIGIEHVKTAEYCHEFSKIMGQKHEGIEGPFECFDASAKPFYQRRNNRFQFARHCVVELQLPTDGKLVSYYYDLTFQCIYQDFYAPYDRSQKAMIFKAASGNDFEHVKVLVRTTQFDVNQHDGLSHWTLLHWAAYRNNFAAVKRLIRDVNPNLKDFYGRLAFQLTKNKQISDFLRQHTNANSVQEAVTPTNLMPKAIAAIKENDRKTIADLFRSGLLGSDVDPKTGRTLLHWAAIENKFEMVIYFVLKGLDHEQPDNYYKRAIAYTTDPEIRTYLDGLREDMPSQAQVQPVQPPIIFTKKPRHKDLPDKSIDSDSHVNDKVVGIEPPKLM